MSDEIHARLNDLRQRVLNREKLTPEEYAEVITALRAKRTGDVQAAAEAKVKKAKEAKAKAPAVDLDELLGGM